MGRWLITVLLCACILPGIVTLIGHDGNIDRRKAAYYVYNTNRRLPREDGVEAEDSALPNGESEIDFLTNLSGASPGEAGYGLDIMYLLRYTNPNTPEARQKKELVELYYKASRGELSDADFNLAPEVYAAIHMNESSGATFLDGIYGRVRGKYSAEDMTLSRFTGAMQQELGIGGTGSVGVDNGRDGYPDGPFQIEQGGPTAKNNARISTLNGLGQSSSRGFDVVFFPDNLSWVNYDFSELAKQYSATFTDGREAAMLASARHNRGSIDRQAFGLPYTASGSISLSSYVTAEPTQVYGEARKMFTDILKAYDTIKPQIFGNDAQSQRALGILLLLKSGWYIETMDGIGAAVNSTVGKKYFNAIFPEATGENPQEYLRDNYVKKPWEMVGITKEEYGRIYGMTRSSYRDYYPYSFLFKVDKSSGDMYKGKMTDGSVPPVVHAWDYIAIGHVAGAALTGETVLLNLLIDAGMPTGIDGILIDPTNPSSAYRTLQQNNPTTFSPIGADVDVSRKFNTLLGLLELSATPGRLKSLFHTYENAGTKYCWGGGSLLVNAANYPHHIGQNPTRRDYVNSQLYHDKTGNPYRAGVTKDEDLMLAGRRLFDCAQLAMCGPSLGMLSANGRTTRLSTNTTGIMAKATGENDGVVAPDGKSYNVGLYKVADKQYSLQQLKDNPSLIPGGLMPGDILVNSSHAFTVLCIAPKNVVIPADIARNSTDVSVLSGSLVTIEAWTSGEYNRVRDKGWGDSRTWYVVRTYMMDG